MQLPPCKEQSLPTGHNGWLRAEAMICRATWSPRPGRELEAKPALNDLLERETLMRKSTKITAALGGAALTVATAGAAYAYWTTTGNGSSSATAGTSSAFAVVVDAPTGAALTPGG